MTEAFSGMSSAIWDTPRN